MEAEVDDSLIEQMDLVDEASNQLGDSEDEKKVEFVSDVEAAEVEEPGFSGNATDQYFKLLNTRRYKMFAPGEIESCVARLTRGKVFVKNCLETFALRRYAETWCEEWRVGHASDSCASCSKRQSFFEEFGGPRDLTAIEDWAKGLANSDVLPILLHYFGLRDAEAALTEICERNQRLVVSVAKHSRWHRRRQFQMIELIQYGNIGLISAAVKFNLDFGNRFSTYAIWWIRQIMDRECLEAAGIIRLPVHVRTTYSQISQVAHKLGVNPDDEDSAEIIASKFATTPEKISDWRRRIIETVATIRMLQRTSSLDRVFGQDDGGDYSLMSIIPDQTMKSAEEGMIEDGDDQRMIQRVREMVSGERDEISKRAWDVLAMRYGLDGHEQQSLRKVAASLKLSPERIRQIEGRTLQKLRKALRSGSR